MKRSGLQEVYETHNARRGRGFAILQEDRGSFLRRYIGTGKRVLDIGCRDGKLTATYATGNTVTGFDIDADALRIAHDTIGIDTIQGDLNSDWDIGEQPYDVVVACEVVEHLYFPRKVCERAAQALVQGGLFIGTVPHAYSLQSRIKFLLGIKRGTPLQDPTHINHFSYRELVTVLSELFDIVAIETYVPPRYRLFAKIAPYLFAADLKFVCEKKT
ncbi:class I SAM-dependent methyltransferase [Candidatus Kaiserbacteria bacterium]|nr:class I SAM-dependent methyltransferase [Candidatus Kaiserbacteria bacterium]